jgi:dipeptide/tripeptide permease
MNLLNDSATTGFTLSSKISLEKVTDSWITESVFRLIPFFLGLGLTKYQYGPDGKLVNGSAITTDTLAVKFNFDTFVYFFPLIGAAVSDSFLNKYWTVALFGLFYLAGMVLLFLSTSPTIWGFTRAIAPILTAIPNSTEAAAVAFLPDSVDVGQTGMPFWPVIISLGLIALGTGGIKPCVSSHGGDQFLPQQTLGLNQFFSFFYISINLGALISGI